MKNKIKVEMIHDTLPLEERNLYTYEEFVNWIEQLVAEGKTSGKQQNEALQYFTMLNLKRMHRISKNLVIDSELKTFVRKHVMPQHWYVITEAWCGDSAQILPVLAGLAQASDGKVELKILLRDENPDLMNLYHTDGSKSIPKLIAFNTHGQELFNWGPRPRDAQQLLINWKKNPDGRSWEEFEKELHSWYARDKTLTVQQEISDQLFHLADQSICAAA